jgi:hypothetical protein
MSQRSLNLNYCDRKRLGCGWGVTRTGPSRPVRFTSNTHPVGLYTRHLFTVSEQTLPRYFTKFWKIIEGEENNCEAITLLPHVLISSKL